MGLPKLLYGLFDSNTNKATGRRHFPMVNPVRLADFLTLEIQNITYS